MTVKDQTEKKVGGVVNIVPTDVTPDLLETPDYSYGFKNERINQKKGVRNTFLDYISFKRTISVNTSTLTHLIDSSNTVETNNHLNFNKDIANNKIVFTVGGTYLITSFVAFDSDSAGTRTSLITHSEKDGTGIATYTTRGDGDSSANGTIVINATKDDYIELEALQTSGSTLNALSLLTITKLS